VRQPGKNVRGQIRMAYKQGAYRVMEVILPNLLNNESIRGIIANYQVMSDQPG
jgi:hypothetical protein